ncbi:MAG TPA: hypothetical protein VFD58_27835 [Blastocatellia bacterium]|nr:hypothetical protein [Blastocatellia bacterium]
MKLYSSFLIRCWMIREAAQNEKFVFDVEHIQRGEHLRAGSPDEVYQWMMTVLQTQQPGGTATAGEPLEADDDR